MNTQPEQRSASWEEVVRAQVGSLKFGVVQIVVHESKVVQIERTEKVRLTDGENRVSAYTSLPSRSAGGRA